MSASPAPRRVRADAQQNLDALLVAARTVFARAGVDAPARDVAAEAGVGVGTLYRHFPNRAALVSAVFTTEIDATAAAADELLAEHAPWRALDLWITRFTSFVATKQGLSAALRSGDWIRASTSRTGASTATPRTQRNAANAGSDGPAHATCTGRGPTC